MDNETQNDKLQNISYLNTKSILLIVLLYKQRELSTIHKIVMFPDWSICFKGVGLKHACLQGL